MSFGKLFLALLLVGLSGCASQTPSVRLLTSGGEKITVDLSRKGAVGPENKDLNVLGAAFLASPQQKKGIYAFALQLKSDVVLRGVKVEDVTETKARLMVDDTSPKVTGRKWTWSSPPVAPDDSSLAWVQNIDESFRVYRFTIVLADGRQIVMHHTGYYPPFVKARMRVDLGFVDP
jgi:predicted GH43/DUF377 family glycosyl hydrolase